GFEKVPYCGINDDNVYTFWDGGDIRRGALPFVGAEPQNRVDNLLAHDDPSGGGGGAAPPPKGRACFVADTPALVDGKLVEIQNVTGTTLQEHEGTFVCRDIVLETGNTISVVDAHCFMTDAGQWVAAQDLTTSLTVGCRTGPDDQPQIENAHRQCRYQEHYDQKLYR
ncbi:MAG: hypothetical protein ACYTBS_25630, partial [Planctomycetota bacterium]